MKSKMTIELGKCYEVHNSLGQIYRFKFYGTYATGQMQGMLEGTDEVVNIEHIFRPSYEEWFEIDCFDQS